MNALYSGDVDIVTYVNWAAMGEIEKNPKYILQSNKEDGFVMIEFRVDQPPFNDVKLRQAVSYGIDREAIIKTAASGRGKPSYGGVIPSWLWGYGKDLEETYKYNPEKAKQLVKEAGAEGKKIELTTWPPDTELFGRPSVIVANQMKQIGLEVTLKPQPTAEWAATRVSGAYQMFMDGNLYALPDPDFLSEYFTTGGRIPQANKFSDKEIDGWLDEARKINDQAKRIPLYANVQKKALELCRSPSCSTASRARRVRPTSAGTSTSGASARTTACSKRGWTAKLGGQDERSLTARRSHFLTQSVRSRRTNVAWPSKEGAVGAMVKHIVRRLLVALVLVLGAASLVFVMLHAVPGDPVRVFVGDFATEEQVAGHPEQDGAGPAVAGPVPRLARRDRPRRSRPVVGTDQHPGRAPDPGAPAPHARGRRCVGLARVAGRGCRSASWRRSGVAGRRTSG